MDPRLPPGMLRYALLAGDTDPDNDLAAFSDFALA